MNNELRLIIAYNKIRIVDYELIISLSQELFKFTK